MSNSITRGAKILAGYRHPDDWKDGDSTGKAFLRGTLVLKVEEIRLGGAAFFLTPPPPEEARLNAGTILDWARSVGLAGLIRIEQQPDKAPYVVVSKEAMPKVLPKLQSLS